VAQPLARACDCASSGVHGVGSGIFQRESNDGSGGLRPHRLKQNVKILYCTNFNDKVERLTYFKDGAIYVAMKVEECWLKLGALLCHTPGPSLHRHCLMQKNDNLFQIYATFLRLLVLCNH